MAAKLSVVLFVAIFGCISGAPTTQQDGKIVGGYPLNITRTPWQVSLQSGGGTFQFCGGSIIGDRWILTAAHCLSRSASSFKVRVGATHKYKEGQLVAVETVIRHSQYSSRTTDYDYGLLELAEPLQFTDAIQPIPLPNAEDAPEPGTIALVSGWGNTQNSSESTLTLRGAEVPVVSQSDCAKAYSSRAITTRMICAGLKKGGKDSCQGDSGGPLVVFDSETKAPTLVGIVSWGRGCALPNYPGVYARVSTAREWIKSKTQI